MTVKETADYLRVSTYTVYRYVERNELPHIKKKFGIRIKKRDLDAFLDSDKRKAIPIPYLPPEQLTKHDKIVISKWGGSINEFMAKAKSKTRQNYGVGAIYIRKTKAGKPRFYADYRDRNGKRVQKLVKNASSWEDAYDALKSAVFREHCKEHGIEEQKQPIRFKKFIDMFLENYSRVNKKSWKDDFYRLRKCISFFGNVYLQEVTAIDIERLKSVMIEKHSNTTVNHYLKILKRLYNIAIDWGYAKENPVKRVKFYSEKDTQKERILTGEEEVRLLEAASGHIKPILIVALNSGMRRGEILNLTWNRIRLEQRQIQVVNTKSGRNRIIPVNDVLFEVLNELDRKSEYVFPNPDTGKPYKTVRRSFENTCRRVKVKGLRFHDLRHYAEFRTMPSRINRVIKLLGNRRVMVLESELYSA